MKGVVGSNNLVGAVEPELAVPAGQLNGPFISFSAAVTEEDSIQAAMLNQKLRQLQLGHGVELGGCVHQSSSLLLQRLYDYRRAVPQAICCPASDEVEVFTAPIIPGYCSLAANEGNRNPLNRL